MFEVAGGLRFGTCIFIFLHVFFGVQWKTLLLSAEGDGERTGVAGEGRVFGTCRFYFVTCKGGCIGGGTTRSLFVLFLA